MEYYELPLTDEKESIDNEEQELFTSKEYELQLNHKKCILIMKINQYNNILFQTRYKNNLYSKEYTYSELTKMLFLINDYYDNIKKIFKFLDTSMTKNKISLLDDKDETIIKLKIKKQLDFDEVNCFLYLKLINETKEKTDKISSKIINYKFLYESIKKENQEIKSNIKLLKNENQEMKKNIESLKKETIEIKKLLGLPKIENEKLKDNSKILIENNEKIKNNQIEKHKDNYENKESENKQINEIKNYSIPLKFKFIEEITRNIKIENIGIVYPFNIIKENAQYLAITHVKLINEQMNNNGLYSLYTDKIYIMILANMENKIIKEININSIQIQIIDIKYHSYDKEEYLYITGLLYMKNIIRIIAFDIRNNYYEKIIIDINDYTDYNKVLLLFDIFKKNYILVSYKKDKFSKLYDYQKNDSFIKNIHGTNNYETKVMIPWYYKDKFYIIDICSEKIIINNLLEDKSYAELKLRGIIDYQNGFLSEDKYLYAYYNDKYSDKIIIWDLINKNMIKNIEVIYKIRSMLLWNSNYAIILVYDGDKLLYSLDIKKQTIERLYDYKNINNIDKIIKIKLNDLGREYLIFQIGNNLDLFERE